MSAQWFCRIVGKEFGPLTAEELQVMVAEGSLTPHQLVRQGSDGVWVKAKSVKGLFAGEEAILIDEEAGNAPAVPSAEPRTKAIKPADPAKKPSHRTARALPAAPAHGERLHGAKTSPPQPPPPPPVEDGRTAYTLGSNAPAAPSFRASARSGSPANVGRARKNQGNPALVAGLALATLAGIGVFVAFLVWSVSGNTDPPTPSTAAKPAATDAKSLNRDVKAKERSGQDADKSGKAETSPKEPAEKPPKRPPASGSGDLAGNDTVIADNKHKRPIKDNPKENAPARPKAESQDGDQSDKPAPDDTAGDDPDGRTPEQMELDKQVNEILGAGDVPGVKKPPPKTVKKPDDDDLPPFDEPVIKPPAATKGKRPSGASKPREPRSDE